MKITIEILQKEKMKYVQLLATYYQLMVGLTFGYKRDQLIKKILINKYKIKKINDKLTKLKK